MAVVDREALRASMDGDALAIDSIDVTMDHFERVLDEVEPRSGDGESEFGDGLADFGVGRSRRRPNVHVVDRTIATTGTIATTDSAVARPAPDQPLTVVTRM